MWKLLPEDHYYYKGGGNGMMMYMMLQMQEQARQAKLEEQARQDRADEVARVQATKQEERQTIADQKAEEKEIKIEQAAKEEKQAVVDQRALDIENSTRRVGDAYSSALQAGRNRLANKNIDADNDPYGIMSMFTGSLDRARASAPEIVSDPTALFSSTFLDDAMTEARSNQRNKFGSQIRGTYSDDYGLRSFGDTADDSYINSILDEQRTEANTALERALARGTINEVGKASGDREIANMYRTGQAKANSLGDAILGGYRSQVDGAVSGVRNRANNWDFGDTFNFDNEQAGVNTLKNSLSGKLEGDILNALSGQSFFDNNILLGKAGNATGITNNPSALGGSNSPLLGSVTGTADKTKAPTLDTDRKLTAADEVF